MTEKRLILGYLAVWTGSLLFFWCFTGGSDAMGFALLFLWGLLPVTTFVVSVPVGVLDLWGRKKWLVPLVLGIFYMLAGYLTFYLKNTLSTGRINIPDFASIISGAFFSAVGIWVGMGVRRLKAR